MKILLISSNIATSPYPVYPLGLSMVAAAVVEAGHTVECFDFLQSGKSRDELAAAVAAAAPDVVGLSIRNIDNVNLLHEERYLDVAAEIVREVRRVSDALVVAGGSAFSILPGAILEYIAADYGVVGEGESAFVELLTALENDAAPPPGTIVRGDAPLDASSIPSARYDRRLLASYLDGGSVASVQTKRGCPLNCVYCSYPALEGRRVRPRDAKQVVDDIEMLRDEHGVSFVFFTDSVFNDDAGTYRRILEEMQRRQTDVAWSAFLKPTGIDDDTVALMKATGLKAAELGTDAACDATLAGQRKSFRWKEVEATSARLMDAGIATAHYFMFGGPGETSETVLEGIDNLKRLHCSAAFVFMGIRILPDTELHELALAQGVIAPDHDLLTPVYYISPQVDREWMETTLTAAFEPETRILFPPDKLDDKLQLLHKLGHAGALWDLLSPLPKA